MIVSLHGAAFFAYHGFYAEEQKIGNHFLVDIDVEFTPAADTMEDNLDNTVNYEWLYDMVCEEMKINRKLIETVAQAVINQIVQQYPFAISVRVVLKKLNPLLGAKVGHSAVTLSYQKG
ncbi:dihydroneopterin aldolase [Mucilaginibacter antarcticus]|uniref:7,8-dihydroneopterin aldolase n=1 Tax=Mucilaginibacter antarcticus TaxID=1855725 RepID=A0ABW5XR55_9SPHI